MKLPKKLNQECVFTINNKLIKQVDGCPMGGLISVVFSDFYVCKQRKIQLYQLTQYSIKDTEMILMCEEKIMRTLNYHQKSIQISFLTLKLFAPMKELKFKFIIKQKIFQCIGLRKFPISTREMQLQVNCTELREQL